MKAEISLPLTYHVDFTSYGNKVDFLIGFTQEMYGNICSCDILTLKVLA